MSVDLDSLAKSASTWASAASASISRNGISRFHKLSEAMLAGEIYNAKHHRLESDQIAIFCLCQGVFVVEHDWLAVLGDEAMISTEEFSNPYPMCAFEFIVNGSACIVIVIQWEDQPVGAFPFVQIDGTWVVFEQYEAKGSEPLSLVWKEILAVSAMLDAGIASSDIVSAPKRLNAKRSRNGKPPLADYRVVKLNRRSVCTSGRDGVCTKKRLHFRRGHWRHLEDRKTWIKWMLVGNPDLGFIDHHYKL